jgi:hypothetical protein
MRLNMTQKLMDLEAKLISAREYNKALQDEMDALKRINEILRREAALFHIERRQFARANTMVFDLTELHLAVMKRVKVDYSHNLIDQVPAENLYGMETQKIDHSRTHEVVAKSFADTEKIFERKMDEYRKDSKKKPAKR